MILVESEIYRIDDVVSIQEQERIKNVLLNERDFPWQFIHDVTLPGKNTRQKRPGFVHLFAEANFAPRGVSGSKVVSEYNEDVESIIQFGAQKINAREVDVLQSRSFLQLPLSEQLAGNEIDTPHLDLGFDFHWVFLYYVKDSDGDTVIYDKKMTAPDDIPLFETLKEKVRITPKQGTLIIFNGLYWHTAEQPKKDVRCIINFNLRVR